MAIYIPQRIFDYKINTSSQTEELITLRRLLSEVGGYASTIIRRDYVSLAKKCSALLRKIEKELNRRNASDFLAEAEALPGGDIFYKDLGSLSISQLELLFRLHPQRVKARLAEGREHLTRYFENRIVEELRKRKAADAAEQMKIDYCLITHKTEMENLAAILSPTFPDLELFLSEYPSLQDMLFKARGFSEKGDVGFTSSIKSSEARSCSVQKQSFCLLRERLVEFVDEAIDRLDGAISLQPLAGIAAQLVELNRRKIVRCPDRIVDYLTEAIRRWRRSPEVPDTEMVEPLLTAAYITKDWSLERLAQRIIRRCYRHCLDYLKSVENVDLKENGELKLTNIEESLLNSAHIAETYSSYIDRYSPRKMQSLHILTAEHVVAG